jgi:hypothetical protein
MIPDDLIDSNHYAAGSIDNEHLADDAVDSDELAAGAVDLAHMSVNSIDSDQYVDGSIDSVHLAADVVTGAKIADDAIDSEHYVDGSIDLVHMSANSVDSDQYVDGSVDNVHLANSSVTVSDGSNSTAISLGGTATFSGTTNEVTVAESSGTVTIGLPDDVTIAGDLTVSGDTTTVNTATLSVEDPLIILASGNNAADAVDIGLYGLYDTSGSQDLYTGLFRDASDSGKWKLFKDNQAAPTTTVNTSGTGYAVGTLVGNLEGNVTGNITGNVTGNTSGTAATVTGGTQASITSAANLVTVGTIGTGVWQGTAIASGYIAADAITGAKIADDAIDSEHYTDGSIDLAHMSVNSIDSDQYVDGSIDLAHLAADSVDGTKIADDAIDSEHYTDGSIDTAHIADDQVTLAKMAGLARGKIIYGNSSGNPTALALGTSGQALTSDGNDIAWGQGGKSTEEIQDLVGTMFTGNTETNVEVTYQDGDGTIDVVGSAVTRTILRIIARAGSFIDCNCNSDATLTITGRSGNIIVRKVSLPVLVYPQVTYR